MPRPATPERMDDPDVGPEEMRESFRFITAVNRWLGGTGALRSFLARESRSWDRSRPIRLLDLGTGIADIPLAIGDWARSRGFEFRSVGLDLHPTCVELAREAAAGRPDVEIAAGDAREALATFGPRSFDYVHAGMFLHHLPDGEVEQVLTVMGRLARRAVVWNDLIRSPLSRLGVRLLTCRSAPIVRDDARLSVEKGFTRTEAMGFAERAGLARVEFRAMPLAGRFRLAGRPAE